MNFMVSIYVGINVEVVMFQNIHRLSECNTNVLVIGYYKNNSKSRIKYHIKHKTNVHAQNIVKNIYHNKKHFYLFMKNISGEMKNGCK